MHLGIKTARCVSAFLLSMVVCMGPMRRRLRLTVIGQNS